VKVIGSSSIRRPREVDGDFALGLCPVFAPDESVSGRNLFAKRRRLLSEAVG
jgi:hypothetical protein